MKEELKKDWLNDLDEDAIPLLEVLSGHASCIVTLFSVLENKFKDKTSYNKAKISYIALISRLILDDDIVDKMMMD